MKHHKKLRLCHEHLLIITYKLKFQVDLNASKYVASHASLEYITLLKYEI